MVRPLSADAGVILGRSKISTATVTKCTRLLARGEVKRVSPRGPVFVGYYIGCPACGFVAAHLESSVKFVEAQTGDRMNPYRLEGIDGARCVRKECRCLLVVEAGELLAIKEDL